MSEVWMTASLLFLAAEATTLRDVNDFGATPYRVGELLHQDDFATLDDWVVEQQPGGTVEVADGALRVGDAKGATLWYRPRLAGPVVIDYQATVTATARVSDMNCFWMASEADGSAPFERQPPRTGLFAEYDALRLYYVGCGGHNNTKTRFRKYLGGGEKPLREQDDRSEPRYLLEPDRPYAIRLVACGDRVQYWRDGVCFFDLRDREPLTAGWFGLRLVNSRQTFRQLRIRRLEPLPATP